MHSVFRIILTCVHFVDLPAAEHPFFTQGSAASGDLYTDLPVYPSTSVQSACTAIVVLCSYHSPSVLTVSGSAQHIVHNSLVRPLSGMASVRVEHGSALCAHPTSQPHISANAQSLPRMALQTHPSAYMAPAGPSTACLVQTNQPSALSTQAPYRSTLPSSLLPSMFDPFSLRGDVPYEACVASPPLSQLPMSYDGSSSLARLESSDLFSVQSFAEVDYPDGQGPVSGVGTAFVASLPLDFKPDECGMSALALFESLMPF